MVFSVVSILLGFWVSNVVAQSASCGFVGGFALRVPNSCPSDSPVFCGTGLQTRCCPNGFACVDGKYCCENGQDCEAASEAHPQCPVSTWSIWAYNTNGSLGWCCEPNYFGFAFLDNSGVGCQPVGQTIDTSTYHTVSQLAAKPLTCSTTSSSSSSSTSTSMSNSAGYTTTTSTTSSGSQTCSTTWSTSTGTGSPAPLQETAKGSSFGPGAIAGVAIGAVAVIVLIALAAWCIGRRSKKRAAAGHGPTAYSQTQGQFSHPEKTGQGYGASTSHYTSVPVQEIGHSEPRANRVPGTYEMP